MKTIKLNNKANIDIIPKEPYNFNANFHKPSHFPSSDVLWTENKYYKTMVWNKQKLGLKFVNKGTIIKPLIKLTIYSSKKLSKEYINNLLLEIRWRCNMDSDISEFNKFKNNKILGPIIKKWKGMKLIHTNSLYESIIIMIVLQNATVRRTVQMFENLFKKYGTKLVFDNKELFSFWEPKKIAKLTEQELRYLKVGYRAKFILKVSEQFYNKQINEFELRTKPKEELKTELLNIYGIGPASVDYLMLDILDVIPPWEQKIMSRVLFNKKLVSDKKILNFFRSNYKDWEKLAFHYIWEDLFWKRKNEHIEWLEKEIRL
jgi:3-methyladenine DNA glycosylase/8-oxoguanine DNA glycosylase